MIAVYKKFFLMLGVTVLLCLSASVVWSETKNLQCKSEKSDFTLNFVLNTKKKTILHKNSYDYKTKTKYDVNKFQKIIEWNKTKVWTFKTHCKSVKGVCGSNKSLVLFDISVPLLIYTSIFYSSEPKSNRMFRNKRFDCFWND